MLKRPARRQLVSLTPLVDVVFILLLFFMLASQFTEFRAAPVDSAMAGSGASGPSEAVLVDLTSDGLRFAGAAISQERLSERVAALTADNASRRVLLRPARGVDMQRAVDALTLLKKAGAQNVSMVARPTAQEKVAD